MAVAGRDEVWRTINGTPVLLSKDGTIKKGPKGMIGKKPNELNKDSKNASKSGASKKSSSSGSSKSSGNSSTKTSSTKTTTKSASKSTSKTTSSKSSGTKTTTSKVAKKSTSSSTTTKKDSGSSLDALREAYGDSTSNETPKKKSTKVKQSPKKSKSGSTEKSPQREYNESFERGYEEAKKSGPGSTWTTTAGETFTYDPDFKAYYEAEKARLKKDSSSKTSSNPYKNADANKAKKGNTFSSVFDKEVARVTSEYKKAGLTDVDSGHIAEMAKINLGMKPNVDSFSESDDMFAIEMQAMSLARTLKKVDRDERLDLIYKASSNMTEEQRDLFRTVIAFEGDVYIPGWVH